LVERRLETREPLRGTVETMAIDVEQGEPIETYTARAIDEEPSTHAGLEMVGRQICPIELDRFSVEQRQAKQFDRPWTSTS